MTWYEMDHARVVLEDLRVLRRYPQCTLHRNKYSRLYWAGELHLVVGTITADPLVFLLQYPNTFPAVPPDVDVIKPELPPEDVGHKWHRWAIDGTVCYVKPSEWQLGTTADEIISKLEDWYFNYVAVKNGLIEEMPDVGRAVLVQS